MGGVRSGKANKAALDDMEWAVSFEAGMQMG
jgi:hypothetical protein